MMILFLFLYIFQLCLIILTLEALLTSTKTDNICPSGVEETLDVESKTKIKPFRKHLLKRTTCLSSRFTTS